MTDIKILVYLTHLGSSTDIPLNINGPVPILIGTDTTLISGKISQVVPEKREFSTDFSKCTLNMCQYVFWDLYGSLGPGVKVLDLMI